MKQYKVTLIQRYVVDVAAYDEQDAFERAIDVAERAPITDFELNDYFIEEIG